MKNRIISLLLVVVMVFGLSSSVFAENITTEQEPILGEYNEPAQLSQEFVENESEIMVEQPPITLTENESEIITEKAPQFVLNENENEIITEKAPVLAQKENIGEVVAFNRNSETIKSNNALLAASYLSISPSTNWTSISAAGGSARTITVSTDGGYYLFRPSWINYEWVGANTRLISTRNTGAARSGTVKFSTNSDGTGITRSFTVSQLAGSATLTISPSTNWSVAASGGTRSVTVTCSTGYYISKPAWVSHSWTSTGAKLTVPANGSSSRSGTVRFSTNEDGSGAYKSFTVTQSAGSATLTISPTTNWSVAASGGTRSVTVTCSTGYYIYKPDWVSHSWTSTGAKLTVSANGSSSRSGTVRFSTNEDGSGAYKSFTVTQAAGSASLTISPSTDWTSIPAAGGSTRTITVTTNLSTYTLSGRPAWLTLEWLPGTTGFKLTALANTGAARSATLTVKGDGVSDRSFNVSQLAGGATTGIVTITYNGNGHTGGTVPSNQTVTTPGNFQFRTATMTKTGYNFVGWRSSGGTLYQVGTTYQYNTATNSTLTVSAEWEAVSSTPYGSLNLAYPLPSNFVYVTQGLGWGRPGGEGAAHNGIDLVGSDSYPNPPIYSIDAGEVKYAGGVTYTGPNVGTTPHGEMGWFVTITHAEPDPYNGSPLIARYLHMVDVPLVRSDNPVDKGETLGYMGRSGAVNGDGTHLHFDINSRGYYWGKKSDPNNSISVNTAIDPVLLWPNVDFVNYDWDSETWPSSAGSSLSASPPANTSFESAVEEGRYIDARIIDLIGIDNLYQWLDTTDEATIAALVSDFNITEAQLQKVVVDGNLSAVYNTRKIVQEAAAYKATLQAEMTHEVAEEDIASLDTPEEDSSVATSDDYETAEEDDASSDTLEENSFESALDTIDDSLGVTE